MTDEQQRAIAMKYLLQIEEAREKRDRNIARADIAEKVVKRVIIGGVLAAIFGPLAFF